MGGLGAGGQRKQGGGGGLDPRPCWRPSKIKVYAIKNLLHGHSNCMMHCQKIGYGRSPSLMTQEDYRWLVQELEFLKDPKLGPNSIYKLLGASLLWLSVTEGDSGEALSIIQDEMSTLKINVFFERNVDKGKSQKNRQRRCQINNSYDQQRCP